MKRNPLHAICPYFTMFPEGFVQKQLFAYSRVGKRLFDPFCGRGTTILEGLLNRRDVVGSDINPVAACVAGAKADVPSLEETLSRIVCLEGGLKEAGDIELSSAEFFRVCFHAVTLRQIKFLMAALDWKGNRVDRFIAAMTLGVLHGKSHKTELCLSNRMPKTISTKPEYSVRWWRERGLEAPERDAFDVLTKMARFRLGGEIPPGKGQVVLGDSRNAGEMLSAHRESVALVITSPPYLDATDYAEDQWLRFWFLGGPDRPSERLHADDRHTNVEVYWRFLAEVWRGSSSLLREDCHVVARIGGSMLGKDALLLGLTRSLVTSLEGRKVTPLHGGETSMNRRRQTNSFRPGTSSDKLEHDFIFAVAA